MDNLDEWMNRELEPSKSPDSTQMPKSTGQGQNLSTPAHKMTERQKPMLQRKNSGHKKPGQKFEHKPAQHNKPVPQKPAARQPAAKRQKPKAHHKPAGHKPSAHRPASSKVGPNKIATNKPTHTGPRKVAGIHHGKLRIIPIGGLNEVGKNMAILEYENDIIILDIGFEFPSEDMHGIDYVIPDVTYLEERKERIRGVVLTHGHLDHIGGLPYILPKLDFPPVYGAKLTLGLVEGRNEEFKLNKLVKTHLYGPDDVLKLGKFTVKFIRIMHSIPDAFTVVVETPEGSVIHTGDFKFDDNPARNIPQADLHKLEDLKNQNILALLCESTNALKPGHSISDAEVEANLDKVIGEAQGRVIISTFSSQIGRLQQIIDAAVKYKRKVYVSGRSMVNNIDITAKLGYIMMPDNFIQDIKKYKEKEVPAEQTLILTTGSQGEPSAALTRMANLDHQQVSMTKNDTVIFSSSPIPGNELAIFDVINKLCILGAKIIHNNMIKIHTSGHAYQDELVRMINYVKPKYLIPIHGEYFMRKSLMDLAVERCGIPEENVIMIGNGDIIEAEKGKCTHVKEQIETKYILIDGHGEGSMDSYVQADRETMSQNGALVVMVYISRSSNKLKKEPDVVSRGFMYTHESRQIDREIAQLAGTAYRKIQEKNPGASRSDIKKYIRQSIDTFTHKELARRPLIIPLIIED